MSSIFAQAVLPFGNLLKTFLRCAPHLKELTDKYPGLDIPQEAQ
jgi:hypothetical protein